MTKKYRRKIKHSDHSISLNQDETFAFIVDYTSGGAPYGITWEELREIHKSEFNQPEDHKKQLYKEEDLPF